MQVTGRLGISIATSFSDQKPFAPPGLQGMWVGGGGMPLNNAAKDLKLIATVTNGRNEMPSFRGVLPPENIRDVSAYLAERLF